jgi:hypothetical protein
MPAHRAFETCVEFCRRDAQACHAQSGGWCGRLTSLLYGCGMRLMDGLRLRVKDQFAQSHALWAQK